MSRKMVYVSIVHDNVNVATIYSNSGEDTLYGRVREKIRDYVSKKYPTSIFVDTRFVKEGSYLNPNKPLVAEDTGIYEMEIYTKEG